MLIRLFATKIVAKSFFGFVNSFATRAIFFGSSLPSSEKKSVGDSEKNATSAPEIKAEKNNNSTRITKLVICGTERSEMKSKLGGSISKSIVFANWFWAGST